MQRGHRAGLGRTACANWLFCPELWLSALSRAAGSQQSSRDEQPSPGLWRKLPLAGFLSLNSVDL